MEPKYGLPAEVRYCSKCVVSNQRPNSAVEYSHVRTSQKSTIGFDEFDVCDACTYAETKNRIDWRERELQLRELSDRFRNFPGDYNCIVPGSGGKDSFFQAHVLKYKFGFRPLTVTWAPHLYTDWGWRNFQRWIDAGFDNYLVTPNKQIHRLLTRLAVENLFHPFQPFILGQKNLAPRLALQTGIPLIFYGENEAEYGNPIADNARATRDLAFFSKPIGELALGGMEVDDICKAFGVDRRELSLYLPAEASTLRDNNVEVHYLGHYLRWHPQSSYYYAVEHGGFEPSPERTPGTYSKYNSIDDKVDDLHYWTTFIKFGIGRATHDAAQEIRNGDITREEGISLVKSYDGEWPHRFETELMHYLSVDPRLGKRALGFFKKPVMTAERFFEIADEFRSEHLWSWSGNSWTLRHQIS